MKTAMDTQRNLVLPDGFTSRSARLEDAELVVNLFNRYCQCNCLFGFSASALADRAGDQGFRWVCPALRDNGERL